MRVGLTGASGLIGSALARALGARGDHVVTFVRPGAPTGVGRVRWDPSRADVDVEALRSAGALDAVVHLAGAPLADGRWTHRRRRDVLDSREAATAALAAALRDQPGGAPYLAAASAVGVYGSRGDEVLGEESTGGVGFLADVCRRWEAAARLTGGPVAHLRTGIVLSRHGGALARQLPLFRVGLGGPLGSGRQWLSPISLRDEVRAILFVIDQRVEGPVNLVGPEPATNREFTRTLARLVHRPAALRVPEWALRAALGRELANELVLASQRAVPGVLVASGFAFDDHDVTSALSWALRTQD